MNRSAFALVRGRGSGRLRLGVLENSQATTLEAFTKATTAPGSIVHTDGLFSYNGLSGLGYEHGPGKVASVAAGEKLLPRAHRAISNLTAGMHGTHRSVSAEHLPVYLYEFVFRHNRRGLRWPAFRRSWGSGWRTSRSPTETSSTAPPDSYLERTRYARAR